MLTAEKRDNLLRLLFDRERRVNALLDGIGSFCLAHNAYQWDFGEGYTYESLMAMLQEMKSDYMLNEIKDDLLENRPFPDMVSAFERDLSGVCEKLGQLEDRFRAVRGNVN